MVKPSKSDILIVGAGPVGLALCVEFLRRGIRARIIDKNSGPTPSHESRALAINLRTLDLMTPSGLAGKFTDAGYQIKQAQFHWQNRPLATITIADHQRPDARMTTLPQGITESIMLDHLANSGIRPRWNTELRDIENLHTKPNAILRLKNGKTETINCDYILGCDGAHSQVRKQAGISFQGEASPTRWSLIDIRYDRDMAQDKARVFLSPGNAKAHFPVSDRVLRIVSNSAILEQDIPHRDHMLETPWKSEFSISYRMVETFSKGNIHLCGDAAHVHSPAGGRGMNLGIEDACWLAWAICEGRLADYNPARMNAAKHVLAQTRAQTRLITGKLPGAAFIVKCVLPLALKSKFVRNKLLTNMLGLDTAPPPWLR